jgi:hypothetical protein
MRSLEAILMACISDDVLAELRTLPYGSITGRYAALKRKKLIYVTDEKESVEQENHN